MDLTSGRDVYLPDTAVATDLSADGRVGLKEAIRLLREAAGVGQTTDRIQSR